MIRPAVHDRVQCSALLANHLHPVTVKKVCCQYVTLRVEVSFQIFVQCTVMGMKLGKSRSQIW